MAYKYLYIMLDERHMLTFINVISLIIVRQCIFL